MRVRDITVMVLSLIIILTMAMKLGVYSYAYSLNHPDSEGPVFLKFLGETKSLISKISIVQADLYFHGGVGHFPEEHEEGLFLAEMEENVEEDHHHEEEHHDGLPGNTLSPFNILFRISREIEHTEHRHLYGEEIKEIIPWLYYSARIDPHNIQAYVLTGFYLADRMDEVYQAISFLKEGLRNNPDSWELNAELGRIYFKHINDYEKSEYYLSKAWDLIRKAPHDKFEERYILTFLAMSYEKLGKDKKAVPLYTRINELFPDNRYKKNYKT